MEHVEVLKYILILLIIISLFLIYYNVRSYRDIQSLYPAEHFENLQEAVNFRVAGANQTVKMIPKGSDANVAALAAQAYGMSEISTMGA